MVITRARAAVRSRDDIAAMARAGAVVAEMHAAIRSEIRPGVRPSDLDAIARGVLDDAGATSNFLGYHGYPAVICASVDDVIVHGIPASDPVGEGSILSIDCGAIVDGWHGDAAFTAAVGTIDERSRRLIEVTEAALDAGIAALVAGNRLGDVGAAIQAVADAAGLGVVEEYTGHGIGREMHEEPAVPNWGRVGTGPKIKVGNVYALEPMFTLGDPTTFLMEDGWTVATADGSRAAHAEHTIAVTPTGPQILTVHP